MYKSLKSTAKSSVIYSLGNISTKLAGFILIPLYTSRLTVSDYGILAILEISTQFLMAVFGLKLYYAFLRFYWEGEFAGRQKSMFFTVFVFLSAISLILTIVISGFVNYFSLMLFDSPSYERLVLLVFISSGLQIVNQLVFTLLRIQDKAMQFSILNILKLIVTIVLTIYFIVEKERGVQGIYEAQIIGLIFSFILLSPYILKNFSYKFDFRLLNDLLKFGFPLIFAEVSGVVFAITSRFCLKFMASLSEVGTYSLGFKIANTINVFIMGSAMLAITPMIFKKINHPDNKRFYAKLMTYLGFSLLIFVLWVSFFSKEIIKLLARNSEYWDAYNVIPILSFAIIFSMMRDISLTGLHITKKTSAVATIITGMSVLNLILNLILIPIWASIGAATATLIAQIIFFIMVYIRAQKHYPIPYELGKIFKMIAVAVCLFILAQLTNDLNLFFRLTIKHILILIFPIVLYYFNFFEKVELVRLREILQKLLKPAHWPGFFSE